MEVGFARSCLHCHASLAARQAIPAVKGPRSAKNNVTGFTALSAPVAVAAAVLVRLASKRRRCWSSVRCKTASATESCLPQTGSVAALLTWLKECGAHGLDSVRLASSDMTGAGAGVFAAHTIKPGEAFVTIPRRCCLVADDGLQLAAMLLKERSQGSSSTLAPFIESVPDASDLQSHPLLWASHPGLKLREVLGICPQSCRMVRHMQLRGAAEADMLVSSGIAETEELARWALAVVESRAVTLGDGTPGSPFQLALCPLIDFLNHKMPDRGDLPMCSFVDDPSRCAVHLVASKSIPSSTELCIVYDECSSAQLFARYGFVQQPPDVQSPHESCLLDVPLTDPDLPGGPDARAARLEYVRRAGWRRSAWHALLLKMPGNAGPGGSLLPLARLAVLPAAESVRQRGDELWNGPLPETALEEAAMALARTWLSTALDRVDAGLAMLSDDTKSAASSRLAVHDALKGLLISERALLQHSMNAFDA